MRVRSGFTVAAAFVLAGTLFTQVAHAQGEGKPAAISDHRAGPVAARPVAAAPLAPSMVPVTRPTVIDRAWANALWTVVDGIHRLDETERRAARRVLAAEPVAVPASVLTDTPIVMAPRRLAWLPAGALRDAVEQSPWELTPVTIEPATESPEDSRGQHGVLLGAKLHLPWMLP